MSSYVFILFIVTHSNLENVLTHTSSSRSHRLTKASALPVAKYLIKIKMNSRAHVVQESRANKPLMVTHTKMHHYFVSIHVKCVYARIVERMTKLYECIAGFKGKCAALLVRYVDF